MVAQCRILILMAFISNLLMTSGQLLQIRESKKGFFLLRISQFLKLRTPSDSEHRALNGLDPTIHAEVYLALLFPS